MSTRLLAKLIRFMLEVSPSYNSDRRQNGSGSAGATSFKEGISGLELSMKGKAL
jgi:hypothetical protein